jgi:hypothetical protein
LDKRLIVFILTAAQFFPGAANQPVGHQDLAEGRTAQPLMSALVCDLGGKRAAVVLAALNRYDSCL